MAVFNTGICGFPTSLDISGEELSENLSLTPLQGSLCSAGHRTVDPKPLQCFLEPITDIDPEPHHWPHLFYL